MRAISRVVLTFASLMAVLAAGGVRLAEAGINVWTSNGPEDGVIRALAIDPVTPSTLYAGTQGGGVFKSVDSGGSWTVMNSGLANADVRALAIDPLTPTVVYAGTYGGGVFRSTNGGGSWSPVNSGLPSDTYVNALVIDPLTPSTVLTTVSPKALMAGATGAPSIPA